MILHYFPRLYEYFVQSTQQTKRYELASKVIGDGSVLDIGCGTGLLAEHLSPGADYLGIDLNEKHLDFARKKGLDVKKMDCMKVDKYPERDVYFICDLLHHINPEHEKLIDEIIGKYPEKTLIVSEPYAVGNWAYEQLVKIMDYDYVNGLWRPEWYEKEELKEFLDRKLEADRVVKLGEDLLAIKE